MDLGAMGLGGGSTSTSTSDNSARRVELAARWMQNEGFYQPVLDKSMLSDDFVFMGPVVGPLNKADYLGTLGVFKIYEAFPDITVSASGFTQDPTDPDRYWGIIRVEGTHTAALNAGSTIPPTNKRMVVGPQVVSVTFDDQDKISRYTGGYIADVRDGKTGAFGAMFAVLTAIGVPAPTPGGKVFKVLNWIGSKSKDYPKARSHAEDLPEKWAHLGRKHGLRTADAWTK